MRVIISILLCYYLTATLGISSAIHTCGGRYAGITFWGLFSTNKCACSKEEQKKKGNCCKEKYSYCKITDEHSSSHQNDLPIPFALLAIEPTYLVIPFEVAHSEEYGIPHNHAPPNLRQQPIYLACRKLLI